MTIPAAPTASLPPIRRIHEQSLEALTETVRYLRKIYNPEVRGTRRVAKDGLSLSAASSIRSSLLAGDASLEHLRSDHFERSYTIRWLTALVAQAYRLEEISDREQACELLIQDAAALLAVCAGAASAGTITRSFNFAGDSVSIFVQVRDAPLENQDYGTVGAQTWGASYLLAEMIAETPSTFGIPTSQANFHGTWRALELGAGTGLVSITLGKTLETLCKCLIDSLPTIVATDFHPSVLANLAHNIKANFQEIASSQHGGLSISAMHLDWSQVLDKPPLASPLNEPFDLILGSDIIYEADHARWIKAVVEQALRKPHPGEMSASPEARFHLVMPLRPTHVIETGMVEDIFPSAINDRDSLASRTLVSNGSLSLAILEKTVITCEAYCDVRKRFQSNHSEVEYAHYVIGWIAI